MSKLKTMQRYLLTKIGYDVCMSVVARDESVQTHVHLQFYRIQVPPDPIHIYILSAACPYPVSTSYTLKGMNLLVLSHHITLGKCQRQFETLLEREKY